MEEVYLTKDELIKFLEDHEINSIRIMSETEGQLRTRKSRKSKIKSVPCMSTMIDIVTTGKKEQQQEPIYEGWTCDGTVFVDPERTIVTNTNNKNVDTTNF